MRRSKLAVLSCALALAAPIALSACSTDDGRDMKLPNDAQIASSQTTAPPTTLAGATVDTNLDDTSSDIVLTLVAPWEDGATIGEPYKCGGPADSPAVSWSNIPAGTASLALVLLDEDSPDTVHWVVANIPADSAGLPAGSVGEGTAQALNSQGEVGFFGPCPPAGKTHEYSLTLYALDQVLELADGDEGVGMQDAIYAAAVEAAAVTFNA
jgi:Raf kinase inhibitor-like YbhB/YbcL family protein